MEVEAIGKVRHKNLVGLVGYCAEGAQRYNIMFKHVALIISLKVFQMKKLVNMTLLLTIHSGCLFMNMLTMEHWNSGCMVT